MSTFFVRVYTNLANDCHFYLPEGKELKFFGVPFKHTNTYIYVTKLLDNEVSTLEEVNDMKKNYITYDKGRTDQDIFIPNWTGITFDQEVIKNIDNNYFKSNNSWNIADTLKWTATNFETNQKPEAGHYSFSLLDENNQEVTSLPEYLKFDQNTANFSLNNTPENYSFTLNNLKLKVEDNILNRVYISSKSFNINIDSTTPTPTPTLETHTNIWAPLMGGIFGGIVFSGLTTGVIFVIKNKRNKDKNK